MVQIEISNPERALEVLDRLMPSPSGNQYPSEDGCWLWISDIRNAIEAAVLEEEEAVWKDLSSFDVDGYSAEINCKGEVRVEGKVFKPHYNRDYLAYHTTFPGPTGDSTISASHFVKVYFNKEL